MKFPAFVVRMVLAFYCLAALDVLGLLETMTKEDERIAWREWIWKQQIGAATSIVASQAQASDPIQR